MNQCQQKRCLRCGERACEKISSEYRCHACGFVEKKEQRIEDYVDHLEERIDRTLDLVEIFNLSTSKRQIEEDFKRSEKNKPLKDLKNY